MSEPVVEQIMANVRSRMASFASAFRSTRVATWQPKDLTIHVSQGSFAPDDSVSCPGNPPAQGYALEAVVAGIVKPSDKDTIPVDTYKNRLGADILAAITNSGTWYQWDGLALNTEVGEIEDYTGSDGAACGVFVRMAVHFRTSELSLYTVRA
jgi:hypothetical protein